MGATGWIFGDSTGQGRGDGSDRQDLCPLQFLTATVAGIPVDRHRPSAPLTKETFDGYLFDA